MGKSQKNDKVGDDITPPIRQSEHALRVGADQGMRMSADELRASAVLKKISCLASCLENSAASTAEVGSCDQIMWVSFFFDGTGNNMDADNGTLKHSNVAKLYRVHPESDPESGVYRVYIPGVGTYFKDISDKGGSLLGRSFGDMGEGRLKWAFEQFEIIKKKHIAIENNKNNEIIEINISAFGFSRGAALARAFIQRFVKNSCKKDRDGVWRLIAGKYKVRIRFMGLFDTVASVGLAMSANTTSTHGTISGNIKSIIYDRICKKGGTARWLAYGTHAEREKGLGADPAPGKYNGHPAWGGELAIPSMVEEVRHFIAAHEVRNSFPLDSISMLDGAVIKKPAHFFETVYPGVHSDVGGSYRPGEGGKSELPRLKLGLIPLVHMYQFAIKNGVPLLSEGAWEESNGKDFDISNVLIEIYLHYLSKIPKSSVLGVTVNSHMHLYYAWRFSCIRKKTGGDKSEFGRIDKNEKIFHSEKKELEEEIKKLKPLDAMAREEVRNITLKRNGNPVVFSSSTMLENEKIRLADNEQRLLQAKARQRVTQDDLLRVEARLFALPDTAELNGMIDIYDKQLLKDAKEIYDSYTLAPWAGNVPDKTLRGKLRPHYKALMEAYENEYIHGKGLTDKLIIDFFDNYVHDSLAGFAKDATLPSDPRVIYIGGDEKYQYAQTDGQPDGSFSEGDKRHIA